MGQNIYYVIEKQEDGHIKYLSSISGSLSRNTYYDSPNLAIEFDNPDTAKAIADWLSRINPDMDICVAKMSCTLEML